nr:MFS transporter [Vulcanisaeta thermophila]
MAAFIRLGMREPMAWIRRSKLSPLRALIPMPQVFLVSLGNWVMVYASSTFMPIFLGTFLKLPPRIYTSLLIPFNAIGIPAMIISGYFSDLMGRRYMGIIMSIAAVLSAAWFYSVVSTHYLVTPLLIFGFLLNLSSGIIPAYLAERFRSHGRATGVGFGYNGPFIISGWTSTFIALLSPWLGVPMAATVMFLIGAVITIVGLLVGPETRDVDLVNYS